jgi:oxygen-independent coproporphyrinogen-3 oxidase
MYGLPHLDVAGWRATVETVLGWEPDHLSAYGLSVDPGSAWGSTGITGLPDEDEVVAQYWALAEVAACRGYEHYEISNYARPGLHSRHNLNYWRRGEYLAAGTSACGFVGELRYGNAKATARYLGALRGGDLPVETSEWLTPRQALAERLILGLRTTDGVPAAWLAERTAGDPRLADRIAAWHHEGLLVHGPGGTVHLTEAGFLVSDARFVDLL